MITGNQKEEQVVKSNTKYVGLTAVEVRAINPTRAELNKLLGKEDGDDDKELSYKTEDAEGNEKLRLTFWLYDKNIDKYFPHSLTLINKVRMSKDGSKTQFINNTCSTSWAESEDGLAAWFTTFQDREKNEIGKKEVHEALVGEQEVVDLMRVWLGRLNWNHPSASVRLDMKSLFNEDYRELRALIDGDFDTPFVVVVGVRTDENDSEKQYQEVCKKAYLPASFMGYIKNGFKFPTDYSRKVWEKFENEIEGEYGFKAHFEMKPLKEYDRNLDVAVANTHSVTITPTNAKY